MKNSETKQKEHFDNIYLLYDKHYSDKFSQLYIYNFMIKILLKDLTLNNCKVLDAMCGSGQITNYLLLNGADVTGLDISQNQIKLFKKKFPNSIGICASILKSNLKSESFDYIIVFGGLHHLNPKVEKAIFEIHRILKPGGYFCFLEPHSSSIYDKLRKIWYKFDRFFDENEQSLDIQLLKEIFKDQFIYMLESYNGNVAYIPVYQSMILRVPFWIKRLYAPLLIKLESFFSIFQSKFFSFFVICQWKKK